MLFWLTTPYVILKSTLCLYLLLLFAETSRLQSISLWLDRTSIHRMADCSSC